MSRSLISWAALFATLSVTPALAATKTPATPSATETVTNLLNQDAEDYGRKPAAPHAVPHAPAPTISAAKPHPTTPPTSFVFHSMPGVPQGAQPPRVTHPGLQSVVAKHSARPPKAHTVSPPVRPVTPPVHPVAAPAPRPVSPPKAHTVPINIDPFKGQSMGYEHFLNSYRIAQIRAKLAQQRYNRMRFEKQMSKLGGMSGTAAPPETATIRRLQATVANLQAHIQLLTERMAHAKVASVSAGQQSALHLIAVMRGNNRRSAVLQWGHATQTVHAGDVVGRFWVRAVHPHSIVLAGPHRLHVLTMTSAIGSVAAESPVSTGGHQGATVPVSDTGNNPLMALNHRLAQMAHQPSLPPP